MNKTITAALALALSLPGAASADEPTPARPTAEARAAEPRVAFWGSEPGRPYDEVDAYSTPGGPAELPDVGPFRLSGYAWVDSGFMKQVNTQPKDPDKRVTYSQGRFVLGAAYRRDFGGLFAEARAQLVAFDNEYTKSKYEPHTQDAFVRVGGRIWDVQAGRFLAWEPYYRGLGIQRYTAEEAGALGGPQMYRLDAVMGQKDEAGQLAVHLYPLDWAAFELAAVYGQELDQNNVGVRPTVALRRFGLLAMGGYEYLKQTPQDDSNKAEQTTKGFAGRLQYTIAGATVGVNAARTSVDVIQIDGLVNGETTLDKTTLGGFLELSVWDTIAGAGYHLTLQKNKQGEETKHHQAFVALVQKLPVPGLSVWGVLGFARAQLEDVDARSSWENDMTSFRVRLQYEFR